MKRLWGILFLFMAVLILNGCILSASPSSEEVTVKADISSTFEIKTLVTPTNIVWSLDGVAIKGATTKSYIYIPQTADAGGTASADNIFNNLFLGNLSYSNGSVSNTFTVS